MIGLVYLAVIGAYLVISVLFMLAVVKLARKKGFNPWLPGVVAALVMYLIVFWDFIPVLVTHNNLCKEQGGYWIYKTPEQWFKENPDAIGKKWAKPEKSLRSEEISGGTRYWYSDYVYKESYLDRNYAHAIRKHERRMVNARTGEILARMVDFERGGGNPMLHADSITDYKFWLGMGENECNPEGKNEFFRKVNEMLNAFYKIGGGKK
jgi:hypothetical protein